MRRAYKLKPKTKTHRKTRRVGKVGEEVEVEDEGEEEENEGDEELLHQVRAH